MVVFKKAKAEQAKLKLGLYGQAGSGKTLTSLILAEGLAKHSGGRVAVVDTEHGTDFYTKDIGERALHPEAFDFDALYTRSLWDVLGVLRKFPQEYSVLVIDSITHLWEAAIDSYSGNRTRADTIPMQAWGKIKRPYKELLTLAMNLPAHVILCGRQKNEYSEGDDGQLRKVGVTMKAEGETPHEPHILAHAERLPSPQRGVSLFFEKDRTSILSGKTITLLESQPAGHTWATIGVPLLSVLSGDSQARVDTADESTQRDIDAGTTEDEKKIAEAEDLFRRWKAKIDLAEDKESLEKEVKGLTPAVKAKMSRDQVAALKAAYLQVSNRMGK
jgi:energy-coupling factor transporter ATP-binding protein EcfA2